MNNVNAPAQEQQEQTPATKKELQTMGNIVLFAGAVASTIDATCKLNELAAALKKAKVRFGKSIKTCKNRALLHDTLAGRGLEGKTLTNAVAAAIIAVDAGRWLGMNPSRARQKAEELANGSPAQSKTDEQKLALLLAGLGKNPAFAGFLAGLDASQANAFLAASAAFQAANK